MFGGARVLLRTVLTESSGYGQDGVALTKELERIGAEVHLDPSWVGVPLPPDVAILLARHRPLPDRRKDDPRDFDVVLQHAEPAALSMPVVLANRIGRGVAWTMWEFGSIYGEDFESSIASRIDPFDAFIGYTHQTTNVLGQYANADTSLHTLQGGYSSGRWTAAKDETPYPRLREWDGTFRFAMVGMLNARKNPWVALDAFNMLKADLGDEFDAELHLKTNMSGLAPQIGEYPGVHVHLEAWSHATMLQFYLGIHCLLAPSWGEGKNLPALEALTTGCPAIVSACSGHMGWARGEYCWITKHDVVKERDPVRYEGQTAHYVDRDELAALMLEAYENRGDAKLKGELGARLIPQMMDWEGVVRRLDDWLDQSSRRTRPIVG